MAAYNDVLKLSDVYVLQQSNTWPLSGAGTDISTIAVNSSINTTAPIANVTNVTANITLTQFTKQFVNYNLSKTLTPAYYTLLISPGSTTINVTSANLTANANIISVPGLTKNTTYTFSILSNTNLGNTATSNIIQIVSATVPGTPTIGTAYANGATAANVAYTAPNDNGAATILSYTAKSTPGCITGTVNQSGPGLISIPGLTTGVSYTFTVTATNSVGTSSASGISNSVTPVVSPNSSVYATAGSYSWVVPAGVTSVSVVAVGGGGGGFGGSWFFSAGGGGGGGLGYKNNYPVTPGTPVTVVVGDGGLGGRGYYGSCGTAGSNSYFCSTSVVKGGYGAGGNTPAGGAGGTYTGIGGGNGGAGGAASGPSGGSGGGAGGYSGNGGAGIGNIPAYPGRSNGNSGTGGGGGSGALVYGTGSGAGGGGGVGIYGQVSNGDGGTIVGGASYPSGSGGTGGSGGGTGGTGGGQITYSTGSGNYGGNGGWGGGQCFPARAGSAGSGGGGAGGSGIRLCCSGGWGGGGGGGAYGAGGGGGYGAGGYGGNAASGAVRIVWPGTTRQFPTTCVGSP
jgi:hypothetical protein